MKTITNETVQGQVQSIKANDYLVQFVIKTIREGEVAWFNVTTTGWEAWNVKKGDEITLTGELTSTVWRDPFEGEDIETFEMEVSSLKKLAA